MNGFVYKFEELCVSGILRHERTEKVTEAKRQRLRI